MRALRGYRQAGPRSGTAALPGGARSGWRGRTISLALCAAAAAGAGAAADTPLTAPSGLALRHVETLLDREMGVPLARFRYVAPALAGRAPDPVSTEADTAFLCAEHALPALRAAGETVDRVVISVSDRAVVFGQPDPDATQVFEAYSVVDGSCIWEMF